MTDPAQAVETSIQPIVQLMHEIDPGAAVIGITSIGDAYANNACDIRLRSLTGVESRFVVKRYAGQSKNASGLASQAEFGLPAILTSSYAPRSRS